MAFTVAKLRSARNRKRSTARYGKVEGQKGIWQGKPEAIAMAKRLAHGNRRGKLSVRKIAERLADVGLASKTGKPYAASVVQRVLRDTRKPEKERN